MNVRWTIRHLRAANMDEAAFGANGGGRTARVIVMPNASTSTSKVKVVPEPWLALPRFTTSVKRRMWN
jgi:hypothetical protein